MKKLIPLLSAILCLLAFAAYAYRTSLAENGGQLVYALDDAYIHMAIARSFAEQGVWGVTPHAFTSSSSSILWTLLLGLVFKVTGVMSILPYVLNVVFAVLVLVLADAILCKPITRGIYRFMALVFMLMATPFTTLLTSGMEHALQILILLGFAWSSVRALESDDSNPFSGFAPFMFLSGFFVAFVRYECAFVALVVCVLLFLRRRWFQSIALGLLVLVPVVVYGWISVRNGWYFFPNSILLKSGLLNAGAGDFAVTAFSKEGFFYWKLYDNPHLLLLLILAVVLYAFRAASTGIWDRYQNLLVLFVAGSALHMQFADAGWFYRYEAYLMAIGLVAVSATLADLAAPLLSGDKPDAPAVARLLGTFAFSLLLIIPAFDRGLAAAVVSTQAMNDRYLEHILPAEFLKRYYNADTVMVNDIGAPCFLTDAKVLDLYGLGNMEPAEFRRGAGGYQKDDVAAWAEREGVRIAIVQLGWGVITAVLPDDWVRVGIWEVPRNIVFGDKEVGWFAASEAEAEILMSRLEEFSSELPEAIEQSGRYRGDEDWDAPLAPYPAAEPEHESRPGSR